MLVEEKPLLNKARPCPGFPLPLTSSELWLRLISRHFFCLVFSCLPVASAFIPQTCSTYHPLYHPYLSSSLSPLSVILSITPTCHPITPTYHPPSCFSSTAREKRMSHWPCPFPHHSFAPWGNLLTLHLLTQMLLMVSGEVTDVKS